MKLSKIFSIFMIVFILIGIVPLENSYGLSEKEPNNKPTQATAVKFGQEYTGTIKSYDDKDYYKITIPEDGYITINTTRKVNKSFHLLLNKNGTAEYYQEDYYYYVYWDSNNTLMSIKSPKIGLKKGTYYFIIDAYTLSTDNNVGYSFKINYTKGEFEYEFNDKMIV